MKEKLANIKDRIWDKLFLDFYLDPSWTLEFKVLNLISGDFLRGLVTLLHSDIHKEVEVMGHSDIYDRRMRFWIDAAWHAWRKETK